MRKGCLTAAETAAWIESGRSDPEVAAHVAACSQCQVSLESLENEVLAMQYSVSGLWFRERISCPTPEEHAAAAEGRASADLADYVTFHVGVLGCRACTAVREEAKSVSDPEIRRKSRSVQQRVTDAMGRFFGNLGGKPEPPAKRKKRDR